MSSEVCDLSSTSSGLAGWSRRSNYLGCAALASIKQKEAEEQGDTPWPLWPEEDDKPNATTVGSIYGHLVQQYRAGRPVSPSAVFHWNGASIEDSHKATCAEARRLFDAYAKEKRPDEYGEVIGVEVPIEIPESIFGLRITGAIDIVAYSGGRTFIDDVKTDGREDKNLEMKYGLRCQKWIYALGYELATGVKPDGCRIDLAIKTQTPKFRLFEYPGVTEWRLNWMRQQIEKVKAAMLNPRPDATLNNCWQYGKPCAFYIDHECRLG